MAVHQPVGPDNLATIGLHDALVSEANTEDRNFPRERFNHRKRYTGVFRPSGTRRNNKMRRLECDGFVNADCVVSIHHHVGAARRKRLHQVVGEGVIVVDEQHAHRCEVVPVTHLKTLPGNLQRTSEYGAFGKHFLILLGRNRVRNNTGACLKTVFII